MAALLLVHIVAGRAPPLVGPYQTEHATMTMPGRPSVDVYSPTNATAQPLRFLSFAHGAEGGWAILPVVYDSLLHSLASWGYVIAATRACIMGSNFPCDYHEHQLKVIDWARDKAAKSVAPFARANLTVVGILGHSMGGEATLFNSEASSAAPHGIGAAVMLHAFTHSKGPPAIPFLAFTGTTDTTAAMGMTERFYDAADASLPRGLVEKVNATHQEPTDYNDKHEPYNAYLPQFVAGWFKLHLDGTPRAMGVDWDELLYGAGAASLCGGGDGAMARCEVHRGGAPAPVEKEHEVQAAVEVQAAAEVERREQEGAQGPTRVKRRHALRDAAEAWAVARVVAARDGEAEAPACPCAVAAHCEPVGGAAPYAAREIFGFGGGNGSTIDWGRVTTVAWADEPQLMCAAHAAGARAIMAAPKPELALTANASVRAEWVAGAVAAVVAARMDGLTFDWEEPCAPGAPEQRWYAVLIGETRAALRALSPGYQVSVCVAWSPDGIDGRNYDIGALARAADLLYVMDYDTRSQVLDACVAGANAPFFGAVHGLRRYLDVGVAPAQLVLGVPWYGYRYPCLPGTAAAAAVCPIAEVPFRGINCSDAAGSEVGYDELMAELARAVLPAPRRDAYQGAAYFNTPGAPGGAESGVVQYWYDDAASLRPKYAHARALGLRGVGPFTFGDTTDATMYEAFDAFLLPL